MYLVQNKKEVIDKGQSVKADRALFQRLLIAKKAGRDVDLRRLKSSELSSVLLALADPAGNLRSRNKSALAAMLKTMWQRCESLSVSMLKTCDIIDG